MFKTQIVTPKFNITMHSTEICDALKLSEQYREDEYASVIIMDCETGELFYQLSNGEVEYASVEMAMMLLVELLGDE